MVRLLTIGSLAGLLMAVGMRLTVKQVLNALRKHVWRRKKLRTPNYAG